MCNALFYLYVGFLCGKCRNGSGVSVLLNKCVSCGHVNILYIIALGTYVIRYTGNLHVRIHS